MNHQTHKTVSWVSVIILALAFFCSNAVQAMPFFSDDFNPATTEPNPTWRFYDPYNTTGGNDPGESSLTLDGTNALISIPAGLTHDLWVTPKNKAPRYLQDASDTNFGIEVKFETTPKASTQSQGIIIQQDNDTFLRFDIFYGGRTKLFIAYVDGATKIIHKPVTGLQGSPKYQQVIRSGDQWTFRYSSDGVAWTNAVTFTQSLTVTEVGFFAGTAGSNPDFISSVDYFMDVNDPIVDADSGAVLPTVINTWYEYAQPFARSGQLGLSQKWFNILGNVSSNTDLSSLTYSLNGSNAVTRLRFGSNTLRLKGRGDFNIEIDPTRLNNGSNSIKIVATDINGLVTSKTVSFDYSLGNTWPLPYTANWGAISNIKRVESIAHIVDGLWELTPNGIRSIQKGYDRTIAIGDVAWSSDYEVTVPITLPSNSFNGIGFGVGWQGHEGRRSPKLEWPLQALFWIRGPSSNAKLEIVTYGGPSIGEVLEASQPVSVTKNVTYLLKSSSESIGNGMSRFKVKFWQQNDVEPVNWNLSANIPTRDGSVLLVDWFAGATFGNVEIRPLSGSPVRDLSPSDTTAPVVSNIQASKTDTTATITWNTNEASNGRVDYGLNTIYGSNKSAAGTGTTHSVALTGLMPKTEYHYQVSSTDASTNTTSSTDLVFTTKASVVGNPNPTPSSNPSGMVSDTFDQPLDANVWSFYDPLGDSTLSMTGTDATISVPAGTSHNLWRNALTAPRIRQAANDTDFEVEVKFDSALSAKYQLQGLVVEQDNANLLRFDFYSDGSVTRIFSASFVNGIPNRHISSVITSGVPLYLRVNRQGNQWTTSYSYNGNDWVVAGVYTHELTVTSVGIFGGNAGPTVPANNTVVDYFKVNSISQGVGSDQQPPVQDDTQTAPDAGMVSDDFNHPLNTSVWTFFDPVGDSALSETGEQMDISVPAGTNHNLWRNSLFAPRIRQAANNTDFEVEVKFDSVLTDRYQLQGITVEQDNTNLLRFDFYSNGSVTRIFSASFKDGIPTRRISSVITDGVPLYLRVTREADQWTMSYSYDGADWIVGGVYTHNLAVTSVAIFGGNAGPTLPEHNVLIDYFKINNNI